MLGIPVLGILHFRTISDFERCFVMRIKGSNASGQWGHCPRRPAPWRVSSLATHAEPEPLIRICNRTLVVVIFFAIIPKKSSQEKNVVF